MRNVKFIITTLLLMLTLTSCKYFGNEKDPLEAFGIINESQNIDSLRYKNEVAILRKQLTDSAMTNPEVYAGAFNHMNEFKSKSERLSSELERTRELMLSRVEDPTDYEKMDEIADSVLFAGDSYSANGTQFLKAINDYNLTAADQLFFFPEAEKIAKHSFSTDEVMNRKGEKVDWLSYNYKGYPLIASVTKIKLMERKVYEVEATFLKALIEKPQF